MFAFQKSNFKLRGPDSLIMGSVVGRTGPSQGCPCLKQGPVNNLLSKAIHVACID